jgi:hypothetical protein
MNLKYLILINFYRFNSFFNIKNKLIHGSNNQQQNITNFLSNSEIFFTIIQ